MDEKQFAAQMEKIYAYNRQRKSEKAELTRYRQDWERLKSLIPTPGEIIKPSEIKQFFAEVRKLVEG